MWHYSMSQYFVDFTGSAATLSLSDGRRRRLRDSEAACASHPALFYDLSVLVMRFYLYKVPGLGRRASGDLLVIYFLAYNTRKGLLSAE